MLKQPRGILKEKKRAGGISREELGMLAEENKRNRKLTIFFSGTIIGWHRMEDP